MRSEDLAEEMKRRQRVGNGFGPFYVSNEPTERILTSKRQAVDQPARQLDNSHLALR